MGGMPFSFALMVPPTWCDFRLGHFQTKTCRQEVDNHFYRHQYRDTLLESDALYPLLRNNGIRTACQFHTATELCKTTWA